MSGVGWASAFLVVVLTQGNDQARAGYNTALFAVTLPVVAAVTIPLVVSGRW